MAQQQVESRRAAPTPMRRQAGAPTWATTRRWVVLRSAGAFGIAGGMAGAGLGCGRDAAAPAASVGPPVEITYHARTGPQGDYFAQWGEKYTAEHPRVVVKQEQFPGGQYAEKLTALLSAGSIGDALWADAISIFGLLRQANALRDLSPIAKREKFEFSVFFPQATHLNHRRGIFQVPVGP